MHERLTAGRGRRFTLVSAPAGFGKTVALTGWLHDVRRPWVWVSLDELDSDLVSFVRVLVAALNTVAPNAGRQALALVAQTARPPLSQLSALVADDLAEVNGELIVVLDDLHLIQEPSIHGLLSLLMRRLPPTIQLVIASRDEPPLDVPLLRRRQELMEIRADDLRFQLAEGDAFLDAMTSAPVALDFVARAVERSEGWAVGLRLLTLGSSPPGSARNGPASVAARERQFVDDYLFEEVLSRQTPELQCFLTQISILDRFRGPLCEAIVDRLPAGDAQRLLDDSMAAGLFLTSLDDEQRWYRLHHLFRDMLRRRLERGVGADGVRVLRSRASDWLASQGLWDEAANQAIDANDVDRVTALVEAFLMTERSISARLLLESWTRRLPPDVVDSNPTLALARCRMLDIRGEVTELGAQLRRVDAMLAAEPSRMSPTLLPIARGQIEAQLGLVLYQQGGDDHEVYARVERALDLLPADQHDLRGVASMLYAVTLQRLGRTDDALACVSAELARETAPDFDYVARLLTGQALVELGSGRLTAGVQTGRRMVTLGEAHQRSLVIGWGHFHLGRVAYEWNDLDGAREHFEAVLALGREAHRICSVNATLGLALTLVSQGQAAEAERLVLAELGQAEAARDSFFVGGLRSFTARLAIASDDLDRAVYWLAGVTLTRQGIASYDVEDPLLTRARVLVASATSAGLDEAAAAVDRAIEAAEARHMTASLVQGLALRALVERSRGDLSRAASAMARSLELGRPGRFTRAFVDLGLPLTGLLVELASHGLLPKEGQRVLNVCRAASGVPVSSVPSESRVAPNPAGALTWRDLDVLHLIDAQLTTGEIALLLGIDKAVVKGHVRNIYSKLHATG